MEKIMSGEKSSEVKIKVADLLQKLNWNKVSDLAFDATTCLSQKSYQTAVGKKTVTAYFSPVDDGEEVVLKAEYESEGNNVCSTIFVRINLKSTRLDLFVRQFEEHVNEAISNSYARKLFLNGMR